MKIKRLYDKSGSLGPGLSSVKKEEELKQEFSSARKVAEVRLGEDTLFYRYFLRISAIPYKAVKKAFLRIESGEVGEFPLTEHTLVIADVDDKTYELHMEHPEDAQEVLTYLKERFPDMEIGYYKEKRRK